MKNKKISKKLAVWTAGIATLCVGAFVAPQIVRAAGNPSAVSQSSQVNTAAPRITLDTVGYELDNAPCAVVGQAYPVFTATAKDSYNNEVKVATRVWLYYYSSTKSRVEVKDGAFTPWQTGEYTVEYTATDADGNKATRIYSVQCVEKSALSISLGAKSQTCLTGEEIAVAEAVVDNYSGGYDLRIQAKSENGKDIQTLDGNSFRPMYEGKYTVEYFAQDYLETASVSYEITVENNTTPVFFESVNIPKYFVQNKSYALEIPTAYHFALGSPVEMTPVVTVEYENGEIVTVQDGEFTPAIDGAIIVKYSLAYGNFMSELNYEARVVNVNYGEENSYEKYFYSEDYIATLGGDYLELFTMTDGAQVEFINPLFAQKIGVTFASSVKYKNYETVELYLTDSVDSSIRLKISFRQKADGGLAYKINDKTEYSLRTGLYSGEKIMLSYLQDEKTLNINETLDIFVKETLAGEQFDGFPSGRAYLSLKLTGVDGTSAISMYKIGNQNFNYNAMDAVPEILFDMHAGGEMQVGDVVYLKPFYAQDVLDYDCLVKFYVIDPSGNFVTALDGTLLDGNATDYTKAYSIVMETMGVYNICMEVSDTIGNSQLYAYGITTVDRTPPTIRLIKGETEFEVGDTVEVWEAGAVTATGEETTVFVYVYSPDGKLTQIYSGSFQAKRKGEYTVFYQAIDGAGNSAMESYQIVVS